MFLFMIIISCNSKPHSNVVKPYPVDAIACKEDLWVAKVESSKYLNFKIVASSELKPSDGYNYKVRNVFDNNIRFKAKRNNCC